MFLYFFIHGPLWLKNMMEEEQNPQKILRDSTKGPIMLDSINPHKSFIKVGESSKHLIEFIEVGESVDQIMLDFIDPNRSFIDPNRSFIEFNKRDNFQALRIN